MSKKINKVINDHDINNTMAGPNHIQNQPQRLEQLPSTIPTGPQRYQHLKPKTSIPNIELSLIQTRNLPLLSVYLSQPLIRLKSQIHHRHYNEVRPRKKQ